ncbi:DUF3880 domain-containing protein [Thalassotalea fonticola]|uniref:DUF3880 domain-containing protein n=1 Tax=Thalassotalea fonticola TaxID=3065649 RepID=A0ABZ0GP58_9GAMM|nr:DUF3880 domain-containing protein [Colwelliaceae bacterium S1-1]
MLFVKEIWKSISSNYRLSKKTDKIQKKILDKSISNLKVACILDEFSYSSFSPEMELHKITPNDVKAQLVEINPDYIFIESAWKGNDSCWQGKLSHLEANVVEIFCWANKNNVITVFWNKEDPVHFSTFLPVAKLADYIFTTDVDSICQYKQSLGHNRIFYLPFAVQPHKHNPIERYQRKNKLCFAGSYYARYKERQHDFDKIFDLGSKLCGVDIYDRNYGSTDPSVQYPSRYHNSVLGKLDFEDIDKAYKGYKFGININTVKQSQGMFARRAVELMASNTVVISNYSKALTLLFNNFIIISDKVHELEQPLRELLEDNLSYEKFRLIGLRLVLEQHTYSHRVNFIKSVITESPNFQLQPKVLVINFYQTNDDKNISLTNYNRQRFKTKEFMQINIAVLNNEILANIVERAKNVQYVSFISCENYYGANYLSDLILATKYFNGDAIGKLSRYLYVDENLKRINDGHTYSEVSYLPLFSAIIKSSSVTITDLKQFAKHNFEYSLHYNEMLSIDPFNYCEKFYASKGTSKLLDFNDLEIPNNIATVKSINDSLNKNKSTINNKVINNSSLKVWSFKHLSNILINEFPHAITTEVDKTLSLSSNLKPEQNVYIYFDNLLLLERVIDINNAYFYFDCLNVNGDFRLVFEYYDVHKQKLSLNIHENFEGEYALNIPANCKYFKISIRIQGAGELNINSLTFGRKIYEPANLFLNYDCLILIPKCKQSLVLKEALILANKPNRLCAVYIINDSSEQIFNRNLGVDIFEASEKLLIESLQCTSSLKVNMVYLCNQQDKILINRINSAKINHK